MPSDPYRDPWPPEDEVVEVFAAVEGGPYAAIEAAGRSARPIEAALPVPVRGGRAAVVRSGAGGGLVPATQAAAVAAGSFLAGAAALAVMSRGRGRRAARGPRRRRGRGGDVLEIVSSRSFLVDVHLLDRR
jgi:hypothetical protein